MAQDHTAALKAMALCRSLSRAELEALAAIAETQQIAAGRDLFGEGDAADGLYLLVAGEIDVIKRAGGGEHTLARLGPGAVLGEISLLTSETRSATGRAVADTRVLRLPVEPFRTLLDNGSSAAFKLVAAIAEVLARRLATMNDKVLELAAKADAAGKSPPLKEKDLAELHRTMQVWSF